MKATKQERPEKGQVRDARIRAGLTQVEAADLVGLGVKQWQHFESGYSRMRAGTWRLFQRQALRFERGES